MPSDIAAHLLLDGKHDGECRLLFSPTHAALRAAA